MGWENIGMQAAGAATGGVMGMILGGYNDERQRRQQEDLQNIQIRGQKEMTDYQMMKQMEMWEKTNFSAQLEQMKKAGLSPGLMYGKGGAGGTTTGSASGSVTGGVAPSGGREVQDMIGMGMQMQLLKAQKENIEADTNLKQTEATKRSGIDTQKIETEILDLTQGIENKKAQEAMTRVQTRLASIDETLKDRTLEDSIRAIGWQAEKVMQEMEQARFETNIKDETWRDKVQQVKADLIGTWLRNAMTKVQTQKTGAEIEAIIRDGIQKWKALEISARQAQTGESRQQHDAWLNDVQKSTQIPMNILTEAVDGILRKPSQKHVQINTERNYY